MKQAQTTLLGLSESDVNSFSISKAIREKLTGRRDLTGLEKEVLEEGRFKFPGKVMGDIFIPPDVLVGAGRRNPLFRDLTVGTYGQGGGFVGLDVPKTFIELLRNKMVVERAGGQFLVGLQGALQVGRQTGAATAYVIGEQATVAKSTQTISGIPSTGHRISAQTNFTKQLFLESSPNIEGFVRNDLALVLAVKMDLLALLGAGGPEPVGIRNTQGIGQVTFGGAATWAKVVSFETNVATQNADIGRISFVSSPTVREKWKTTPKVATYPVFLWESSLKYPMADGEANGYGAFSTQQISDATVCFGNFEDFVSLLWGGIDVTIDPFSQAQSATVQVVLNAYVDNMVRHPASFVWSTDSGAQ